MPKCACCPMRSARKSYRQEEIEKKINITFHVFPTDRARTLSWIKAMGLSEKIIHTKAVLCSLHFTDNDFYHNSVKRFRLKETAIPSVINPLIPNENIDTLNIVQKVSTPIVSDSSVCTTFSVDPIVKNEDTENLDSSHDIPTHISSDSPLSTEFAVMNPVTTIENTESLHVIPTQIECETPVTTEYTVNISEINTDAIESLIHILRAIKTEIFSHPSATDFTVSIPQTVTDALANFKGVLRAINTELTLEASISTTTVSGTKVGTVESQKRYFSDSDDNDEFILKRKKYCIASDHTYYQEIQETPQKENLRTVISEQRKVFQRQIKSLKQNKKRQDEVIRNFKDILHQLVQKKLPADKKIC